MLEPVWYLLAWVGITLRLYLGIPWLYLNKMLAVPLKMLQRRPLHSLFVVGDGFAEGVGDWTVAGASSGLASHLDFAIERTGGVHHPWIVHSFGQWCSSSRDWRPDATAGAANLSTLSCLRTRPLLAEALRSEHYGASSAVVLIAGAMDGTRSAMIPARRTGENVALAAAALSRGSTDVGRHGRLRPGHAPVSASGGGKAEEGGEGKAVLVVGLPANAPDSDERNDAIRAAVAGLGASLPVVFVPYPELTKAHVCFDGLHPSSAGYKAIAQGLAAELGPLLRGVEATMAVSGRQPGGDGAAAARVLRKLLEARDKGAEDELGDHDGVAEALGAKLTQRRAGPGRDSVVRDALRAMGRA